jgi:hypothetical protein
MKFYKTVIQEYTNAFIVYEDTRNPCVSHLIKDYPSQSKDTISDIQKLCSFQNIGIGFGTFGFMIYLFSKHIQTVWIPKYCIDELPSGDWGRNLHILDFPEYIKSREWNNTEAQRQLIINYQ